MKFHQNGLTLRYNRYKSKMYKNNELRVCNGWLDPDQYNIKDLISTLYARNAITSYVNMETFKSKYVINPMDGVYSINKFPPEFYEYLETNSQQIYRDLESRYHITHYLLYDEYEKGDREVTLIIKELHPYTTLTKDESGIGHRARRRVSAHSSLNYDTNPGYERRWKLKRELRIDMKENDTKDDEFFYDCFQDLE